ncbi:sensor histidine kinase [Nesterenkonia xinjiangensis]|uniref:histidine kinase n=1 Tax=Nesterenkonia xinjiangensis TaxID=225327 RepID=A0A7Z0GMU4_9MICC|nr:sensor histidine kinase [Nesterenkonia xinjiangensis]NYJ78593.1 signal transduction histidine kinase [Nesterenkonia xinjiangensis]
MPAPVGAEPDPSARVQRWLVDAVLGVAVFGAVAGTISADVAGDRDAEPLAYLWAFGLGALMLVRRRFPLGVLGLTFVAFWAYYMVGYPTIGLSVPTAAALYSAAEFRRAVWAVSAAVLLLGGSYFYRLVIAGQDPTRVVGYELSGHVALMTAAIALGVSMRLRRELRENTQRLLEAAEAHERSQAAAAIATERADIARELHDSLGHRTTVISLHADVAREALDRDRRAAEDALDVVKSTSGEMMDEMRRTVQMLRRQKDPRSPLSLDALEGQVFDLLPLEVHARIQTHDDERLAPDHVQAAAYRIVQEALTNVVRHSAADSAEVAVTLTDGRLQVTVRDPGPARPPRERSAQQAAGLGLHGMRERAEALGGSLAAGPEGDGFAVHATLPAVISLSQTPATRPAAEEGR